MGRDDDDAMVEGEYFPFEERRTERNRRRRYQSDAGYAAMIENLDTNIGRLLDALEADGCAEETLIVFTSDNGGLSSSNTPITCNLPLCEGKGWMYDGGTRVSQIVRWPGVTEPGSLRQEPMISSDWYPTLLEAAHLPLDPIQHGDGKSLLPLLRGEPMERGPIFWHYPHYHHSGGRPACAIREGDWKLIEHFEDGRLELFNLRDDIGEQHDRSADLPDRTEAMHTCLKEWREEVAAILPRKNPNWRPANLDELGDAAEL